MKYSFENLLNDLKMGREIEFDYNDNHYSIVNSNGKWLFCKNNHSEELCDFEEKDILLEKVKFLVLQNESMESVIEQNLYAQGTLYIL